MIACNFINRLDIEAASLPWEVLLSEEALVLEAARGRVAAHMRGAVLLAALQAAMAAVNIHPPLVIEKMR